MADNRRLVEELALDFRVLSDGSRRTISAYGLLHPGAGMGGADIARPAILLVGRDGTVRWQSVTENWRVRVHPDVIIAAVSKATREQQPVPTLTPDPS